MYEPMLLAPGMMMPPMGMQPSVGMTGPTIMPSCYNQVSLGMGPIPYDSCSFSTPATSSAKKVWDFVKTWGPLFLLSFCIVKFTNGFNGLKSMFSGSNPSSSLGRLTPKK